MGASMFGALAYAAKRMTAPETLIAFALRKLRPTTPVRRDSSSGGPEIETATLKPLTVPSDCSRNAGKPLATNRTQVAGREQWRNRDSYREPAGGSF